MTTYRRIEAVRVTVSILRALANQRQPVNGQELAREIDVPAGTVMCHLATLEDEGLVRSIGGAYELGMGMSLFWARYKSLVEGKIDRLNDELKQLEVDHG